MHAHDRSSRTAGTSERKEPARRVPGDLHGLLALQRSIGNEAVTALLRAEEERAHDEEPDPAAQGDAIVRGLRSPGRPLGDETLTAKESEFQADLSGVRVHTGPAAQEAAAAVQARAFTVHQDIVLGARGDDPEVLDHELTHVVRNQQGVTPGHDTGGGFSMTHPNDSGEREAAANAARMRAGRPSAVVGRAPRPAAARRSVQRASDDGDTTEPADPEAAREALTASLLGTPSRMGKAVRTVDPLVNQQVRKALSQRLKSGPLFSDEDLAAIRDCDPTWLRDVGLGTHGEAVAYHDAGKYHQWLTLAPGKRVLIATIAWNKDKSAGDDAESHKSPAYTLGRTLRLLKPDGMSSEEVTTFTNQHDRQIREAFVDTLVPRDRPEGQEDDDATAAKVDRARDILTRVFLILQNGLKVYKGGTHVDYREGDVARALAHGGRVNIRIPQLSKGDTPFGLSDWIGLTDKGKDVDPAERRGYSSHRMSIGKNKKGEPGTGRFEERGGKRTGLRNGFVSQLEKWSGRSLTDSRSYGIDPAAGGWGSKDFNSEVVTPDGGHGHLFLRFQPPDAKTDGGLQIGMETTGPGALSPVGHVHDWTSTEKTANPESSFYGHKQNKIGEGKDLAVNQRMVVLQEFTTETRGWLDFLRHMEEYWNQLLAQADGDPAATRELYEQLVGRREDAFQPPDA